MNGILFVDKSEGWTSHDAVAKARRVLGTRKVGHAGTLDPMATGLLTLGVGPSTRLLTHLVGLDKTYTATMRLGEATSSDDRMSDITEVAPPGAVEALDRDKIHSEVWRLTGDIEQVPSQFSAIKVDGRRAYDLAREGHTVELKKRSVKIHAFQLHHVHPGLSSAGNPVIDLEVTVNCSAGTYIRALARDLGRALGVGGHLTALRRISVGPFSLPGTPGVDHPVRAVRSEELAQLTEPPVLTSPAEIATTLFPTLRLDADQAVDLGHGKRLSVEHGDTPLIAAIAPDGRLVGLVSIEHGETRVVTNFPTGRHE